MLSGENALENPFARVSELRILSRIRSREYPSIERHTSWGCGRINYSAEVCTRQPDVQLNGPEKELGDLRRDLSL